MTRITLRFVQRVRPIAASLSLSLALALVFGLAFAGSARSENRQAAADESVSPPPGVPAGYRLQYEQNFTKPNALGDFAMTDPSAWTIAKADADSQTPAALELTKQSDYKPEHRSPFNIALVKNKAFGDCVIEADCMQTGKEYGHRDMVFVFGFQSPSQYYYVHISTQADDHANNIFIVKDAPRIKIAKTTNSGNQWGLNVWRKVRIVRKASDGTIEVYFDDMTKPIMTGKDQTFGAGWVGFGSFDDTGKIANIRVWAPDSEDKTAPAFSSSTSSPSSNR